MSDCVFCKIVKGEIPSTRVYEDEEILAFRDANPQAPTHILVVPKEHMANVLACAERKDDLIGKLFKAAAAIAREQGVAETGFRLVTNCGEHGAQSVHHLHIHLLGGRQLTERMV